MPNKQTLIKISFFSFFIGIQQQEVFFLVKTMWQKFVALVWPEMLEMLKNI